MGYVSTSIVEAQTSIYTPLERSFIEHFGDDWELMMKISKCESGLKQFREDGSLLISPTRDFGIMQVNEKTWDSTANDLGLDYKNSLGDNLSMGKYILGVQGISAWKASKKCWGKTS